MLTVIYNIIVYLYFNVIRLVAPFNRKAKKFINGRKDQEWSLISIQAKNKKIIWFHAASLGEFEQGRPVIEQIRKNWPDTYILLTFFSPSGYESKKYYAFVDSVCYIPIDTKHYADKFINTIRPDLAIFVKSEFWINHLTELISRNTPIICLSGVFRFDQIYFNSAKNLFLPVFRKFTHFFVQDEGSKNILKLNDINQITVTGDTRCDRVIEIADHKKDIPEVDAFAEGFEVMVFGSVWPSDMKYLNRLIQHNIEKMKFIIAPHQIEKSNINRIMRGLPESILFSEVNLSEKIKMANILVIDNVGMLSSIYAFAKFAYVGGGFQGRLHNILEAAVYGIPVFFGKHKSNGKFIEAQGLVDCGGGFSCSNENELYNMFSGLLGDSENYEIASKASFQFVNATRGATKKVMNYLERVIEWKV